MATMAYPWLKPATPWQQFRRNPALFLAQALSQTRLYPATPLPPPSSSSSPISIVCISDTHCTTPELPDGDVLLHAGDLTDGGSFEELQAQLDWLKSLPHRHKVVIGGNHDKLLDADYVARFPDRIHEGEGTSRSDLDWGDLIYLNNSTARLKFADGRTVSVYGSPWTETFGTWAFQYPPIRQVWRGSVPDDTDILLTHGPPKGHLDLGGKGCPQLLREMWRARPRLVVFGHIHAGHGREDMEYGAVEAARDGVVAGSRGMVGVLAMAFWMFWRSVRDFLGLGRRPGPGVTMVNAAMVGGIQNSERRLATVVQL